MGATLSLHDIDGHAATPPRTAFSTLARGIIFAQAIIAFGALAFTREIHPVVMGVFLGGWVAGWIMGGPPPWARAWMGNALVIILVTILAMAVLSRRIEFFSGVLTLLLLLVLSKCILLRTSKDYIQAQVLSFFVLISTSVITVSFHFVLFFISHLFVTVFGLIYYSLAQQAERGAAHLYLMEGGTVRRRLRMPRRLLFWGSVAFVVVALQTLLLFIFIPHVSTESLEAPLARRTPANDQLTGFSEEVELGEFKQLTPDSTVVMRAELNWPPGRVAQRPESLLLRGVALEYYDEKRWRRSPVRREARIDVAQKLLCRVESAQRGTAAILKIYQDPDITMRVFTPPWPQEIEFQGEHRVRHDPDTVAMQVVGVGISRENTYTNPFVYQVRTNLVENTESNIADLIRAKAREAEARGLALAHIHGEPGGEAVWRRLRSDPASAGALSWIRSGSPPVLDAEERLINTELPVTDLSRRVRELARQIAPGPTPEEITLQVLNHLRRGFTYTLAPGTPAGMHPIDAFLFQTRRGHCEYFATAMVLMLRSRGVPARLVNGFVTSEWSEMAGVFKVKQSDAHAWVEVWLDGAGWLSVDPTPPESVGRRAYGAFQVAWWEQWNDYLRLQWQRYVIDYSAERQLSMLQDLKRKPGLRGIMKAVDTFREWSALGKPEPSGGPEDRIWYYIRWFRDVVILCGILFALVRATLWLVRRDWRRTGKPDSPVDYYRLLAARLARLGFNRAPGETPGEFITGVIDRLQGGADLPWLIALYNRHRYGGEPATADERARAVRLINSLALIEEGDRA